MDRPFQCLNSYKTQPLGCFLFPPTQNQWVQWLQHIHETSTNLGMQRSNWVTPEIRFDDAASNHSRFSRPPQTLAVFKIDHRQSISVEPGCLLPIPICVRNNDGADFIGDTCFNSSIAVVRRQSALVIGLENQLRHNSFPSIASKGMVIFFVTIFFAPTQNCRNFS